LDLISVPGGFAATEFDSDGLCLFAAKPSDRPPNDAGIRSISVTKARGLTIRYSILMRTDEVIE
jgi:hypothetical protein